MDPSEIGYQVDPDALRTHYNNNSPNTPFIVFNEATDAGTAFHEYGHHIDFEIEGGDKPTYDCPSSPCDHWFTKRTTYNVAWVEGFAEFYEAVATDYYNANYSEVQPYIDNKGDGPYSLLDCRWDDLPATYRQQTEGAIACFLYSLLDGPTLRCISDVAPYESYIGDNEDLTITASQLITAMTLMQAATSPVYEFYTRLLSLFPSPKPENTSITALYNYLVGASATLPRPATPTGAWITTTANSSASAVNVHSSDTYYRFTDFAVGCLASGRLAPVRNVRLGLRIYRKLNPSGQFNGVLDGTYLAVANINPSSADFVWTDSSPSGGPTRYVVAAYDAGGNGSIPRAEATLVPPAYFTSPTENQWVADHVSVVATINARSQINGYSISSELDSFAVDWASDTAPSTWHTYGVDYAVSRTAPAAQTTVATCNAGVVPSGAFTLRIRAHYGNVVYTALRVVNVQHHSYTVATSGGDFAWYQLQSAIDAAAMGDTIKIKAGSYQLPSFAPTIVLRETILIIASGGGVNIDSVEYLPMISATSFQYPAIIEGIRFYRQTVQAVRDLAILTDAVVAFRNCTFEKFGTHTGGAIVATGKSNLTVSGCTFTGTGPESNGGSVIQLLANSSGKPTMTAIDCVFEGNDVSACSISYLGSNPLQGLEPKPYFQGCLFANNHAGDSVVRLANSLRTIVFYSCTFVDNETFPVNTTSMATISCESAKVLLDNCTLAKNKPCTNGCSSPVGGVLANGTSPVTIEDCIIAFNDGPAVYGTNGTTPSNATMTRSVLFGNTTWASARTDAGWVTSGQNVVNMNPAFCDAANGDYELYAFSPAAPPYYSPRVGAFDVSCVPAATVTVLSGDPHQPNDPLINPPDTLIFGCPKGDGDTLVVRVDFLDSEMTRTLQGSEVTLEPPYLPRGILTNTPIHADAMTSGYVATIRHRYLTGHGTDLVPVYLNGHELDQKALVKRRSPDLVGIPYYLCDLTSGPLDGNVTLADLNFFGCNYQSPPKAYVAACDLMTPDGGTPNVVTLPDWIKFGAHFNHVSPFNPPLQTPVSVSASAGTVRLEFTEEQPLAGQHTVRAQVILEGVEPFTTAVISLANENPLFTYLGWTPDPSFDGTTICAEVIRDGVKQVFLGAFGATGSSASTTSLGTAEFVVESADPVQLTAHDFELVIGDILSAGGEGVSGPSGDQQQLSLLTREITLTPPTYHNELAQNYPNPFNPTTTLAFSLAKGTDVDLRIFDVRGALVKTLVQEHRAAGNHRVPWDGVNQQGNRVASGVYFYKLVAGSFVDTKKMVMLK